MQFERNQPASGGNYMRSFLFSSPNPSTQASSRVQRLPQPPTTPILFSSPGTPVRPTSGDMITDSNLLRTQSSGAMDQSQDTDLPPNKSLYVQSFGPPEYNYVSSIAPSPNYQPPTVPSTSIPDQATRGQTVQEDSFQPTTAKSTEYDETWVTVFGFPAEMKNQILHKFLSYGQILQHSCEVPSCNWVHIQYSNRLQAQVAMSKNGKVLFWPVIIGVLPTAQLIPFLQSMSASNSATQTRQPTREHSRPPLQASLPMANQANAVDLGNQPTKQNTVISSIWDYLSGY